MIKVVSLIEEFYFFHVLFENLYCLDGNKPSFAKYNGKYCNFLEIDSFQSYNYYHNIISIIEFI
jgi:hypothetical protein